MYAVVYLHYILNQLFVHIHHVHDLFQTKLNEAIYLRCHIQLVYSVALAFYCRYDDLFYHCATHLVVGRENWCERLTQPYAV